MNAKIDYTNGTISNGKNVLYVEMFRATTGQAIINTTSQDDQIFDASKFSNSNEIMDNIAVNVFPLFVERENLKGTDKFMKNREMLNAMMKIRGSVK